MKIIGLDYCELCGENGTVDNPITAHHCDGNHEDDTKTNLMAVHRWRCHTWADAVTQCYMAQNRRCSWKAIKTAYDKLYDKL